MAYRYLTPYRSRQPVAQGGNMLFDLNRQINRLFDDFFDDEDGDRAFANGRGAHPLMDVSTEDDFYEITVELPGVKQDDLDVTVSEGTLAICGEKRSRRERDDAENGWSERSYGKFERRLALPRDIDEEKISADFEDGVLTITVPRADETAGRRRIAINSDDYRSRKTIENENRQAAGEKARDDND